MTCRGYDPKAIKISKAIKTMASTIVDNQLRNAFIKDYVLIAESNSRTAGKKDKEK